MSPLSVSYQHGFTNLATCFCSLDSIFPLSTRYFSHSLSFPPKFLLDPAAPNPSDTVFAGYLLLLGSFLFFVIGIYATVAAKFLPEVGHPVLDFVRGDQYYTLLAPLLIPVVLMSTYLNWLGLKFFRHNA
jgi:hypothetical protein